MKVYELWVEDGAGYSDCILYEASTHPTNETEVSTALSGITGRHEEKTLTAYTVREIDTAPVLSSGTFT